LTTILSNETVAATTTTTIVSSQNQNANPKFSSSLFNATTQQTPTPTIILNYSLHLNMANRSLFVRVISLENVKFSSSSNLLVDFNSSNTNETLNVYVRVELLSPPINNVNNMRAIYQRKMAKTRSIKQRQSPIYDEAFEFRGGDELNELFDNLSMQQTSTTNCFRLVFNVCNSNLYGRDQILGLAVHNLLACDLNNQSDDKSVDLPPRIYSKKVDLVDSKVINSIFS